MSAGLRALSFGEMAEEYDRWRPSYPSAAVDWLAPPAPARVVEIGAGTGRLTSLLVAHGLEVDAVEPVRGGAPDLDADPAPGQLYALDARLG